MDKRETLLREELENGQEKIHAGADHGDSASGRSSRSNGRSTLQACREAGIVEQTFYRWRKEYGRLKLEQAKRMKSLEKENTRLRHVVAELALEKQILKDVAEGNF